MIVIEGIASGEMDRTARQKAFEVPQWIRWQKRNFSGGCRFGGTVSFWQLVRLILVGCSADSIDAVPAYYDHLEHFPAEWGFSVRGVRCFGCVGEVLMPLQQSGACRRKSRFAGGPKTRGIGFAVRRVWRYPTWFDRAPGLIWGVARTEDEFDTFILNRNRSHDHGCRDDWNAGNHP